MSAFDFLIPKQFGKLPAGKRLERIKSSPQYRNGAFQNQSHTPDLTDGATYWSVGKEFFFGKKERVAPVDPVPSVKTDLHSLRPDEDVLVWFGHSSYFIQADGRKILVDPVLSGHASPFSFTTKAFNGSDQYTISDIPNIDYLFISHDHYDHLDYRTMSVLKPKVAKIICGLGTGAHFEHWGFDSDIITELDWNEKIELQPSFVVNTVPARHFSGRLFTRNQSLWLSYVLQTSSMKIFLGGDSGYDDHFKSIGNNFGPFDLAILENGQYDKNWKHIHLMPHEILTAAKELNAKRIFPVHSGKFKLGNHAWDEPLEMITQNNVKENMNIITPIIGEKVNLQDASQQFSFWWREVK